MTTDVPDALSPRVEALYHDDVEFRAAEPSTEIRAAARQPGLRLVQVLETLMDGYAERPAMGMRATELVNDPATGRFDRHLRPDLETITYGDLWSDVKAIAAAWSGDEVPVGVGDFVATIGFASADYLRSTSCARTWDWCQFRCSTTRRCRGCSRSSPRSEPRVLAVSADYLDLAVECGARAATPCDALVVFDYDADVDDHASSSAAGTNSAGGQVGSTSRLLGDVDRPRPQDARATAGSTATTTSGWR